MGFETKVLSIVADILEDDRSAGFYNGSMFVDCSARQATVIKSKLLDQLACDIMVSRASGEYAFDFV